MSLFQVRAWWQVKCGDNEEFDQDHLIVGNIDNDPNNVDKIVTASLEGTIRIYSPTSQEYKVEHLVLEVNLKHPILQIAIGNFVSNDRSNYLAVLHSRELIVYSVIAFGGFGSSAQYYELNQKYSHSLDRNAFNFIYGKFGQILDHTRNNDNDILSDNICIQSIDGKFWVIEQEHCAFTRNWNNFIVPGCMAYVPGNDSILTMTSEMKLYSYNYNVLSTSTAKSTLNYNWSINLGDHAMKIINARFTSNDHNQNDDDIIVLCEKSLFVLNLNGVIIWQKKFDYNPSNIISYKSGYLSNDNLIITSFQNSIHIYSKCKLIWSARLTFSCCDISIGTFNSCRGMQCMLSDNGNLMIGYLGTDISSNGKAIPIHVDNREPNWDQIENELKETKLIIKQLESDCNNNNIAATEGYISVSCKSNVESCIQWIGNDYMNEKYNNTLVTDNRGNIKCFKSMLELSYTGTGDDAVSNIQIIINVDDAFICNKPHIFIESMDNNNNTFETELTFLVCNNNIIPSNRDCNIYVIYLNESSDCIQTTSISFKLPFALILYPSQPIKNTKYIFTLQVSGISQSTELLPTELFSDLINNNNKINKKEILRTPQALTFLFYCNNSDVTLLLSRGGSKIRIQSGSLYCIWYVLDELINRISKLKCDASFKFNLKDNLPLNAYFEILTNRYTIFNDILSSSVHLNNLSSQFRLIQKRLLTRYFNKNPTPLNKMDILLKQTYQNIINSTNKIQKLYKNIKIINKNLFAITKLLWILMKLKYKLNNENMILLKSYLCIGTNEIEEGWEEQIESSMVYVLRTCLAKNEKDTKISQHTFGKIKDIKKVTRHIKIVCDRLERGQRFTDKPQF